MVMETKKNPNKRKTPSILDTSKSLATLKSGYRAWFWLCVDLKLTEPILLISSFQKDPELTRLKLMASRLVLPYGAFARTGILTVGSSGNIQLAGSNLSSRHLKVLATWTQQNSKEYPNLARLKDASLVNISGVGKVLEHYVQPDLWHGLEKPVVSGTIEETAVRLTKLRPDRNFWFWMTDKGPGENPFLYLGSSKNDPDGKEYASKVANGLMYFLFEVVEIVLVIITAFGPKSMWKKNTATSTSKFHSFLIYYFGVGSYGPVPLPLPSYSPSPLSPLRGEILSSQKIELKVIEISVTNSGTCPVSDACQVRPVTIHP